MYMASPCSRKLAHSRPRWAGGTSIRDKLEVWLPRTGPYPSWGAAGPVGGGSRGAQEGSADPSTHLSTRGGKGLKVLCTLPWMEASPEVLETGRTSRKGLQ